MTSADEGSPKGRRRPTVLAIILGLATLTALTGIGVVVALLLGDRRAPAAVAASPGADAGGGGGRASCAAGESGPMRLDTRFTAGRTKVPYSISFPAEYYQDCRTYPVVYVLHGKTQSNVTFMGPALRLRRAMDAGVLDQAIIVTPDSFSTGRWENSERGPAEDNFIKLLIPHVEKTYRVEPGASHRLLAGFSMGGHGALRFGLKYPQLFAGVWSVDGAMWRQPRDYLPLATGKSAGDFHIVAVGGQLNGARVQAAVDTLEQAGITVPYTYQDREHSFEAFVEEDEKAGWPALRYLQQQLGRPM